MNLAMLNDCSPIEAEAALSRCCGSRRWVEAMLARRPFASVQAVEDAANEIEAGLSRADWLEAFAAHPRIGDFDSLKKKFAATAAWSESEQAGIAGATDQLLRELAECNRRYEQRFGHIFIVCATGKSAAEMLALLLDRLTNAPDVELAIAAAEQAKITRLRLEKL